MCFRFCFLWLTGSTFWQQPVVKDVSPIAPIKNADVLEVDGKHYLATAFELRIEGDTVEPDDQHSELRLFRTPFPDLHPYVERYLDEIGLLERAPATPDDHFM